MKLRRGDQSRATVAVSLLTGLPPGLVLRADNLEDVSPPEGHRRLLAGDGGILAGVVVEERSDEQLRRGNSRAGERGKCELLHSFFRILATDIWSFFTCDGVIFEHRPRSQTMICLNPVQMLAQSNSFQI